MLNLINHIYIRNFKSIKECEINECKRINLFIGRPNVGKSNILEALSLFSIPYLKENTSRKISNLVRVESETELFYDGDFLTNINVVTDELKYHIEFNPNDALRIFIHSGVDTYSGKADERMSVKALSTNPEFETYIKRYVYRQDVVYRKGHSKYLIPPFGSNLLSVIERYEELKKDIVKLFSDYGIDIAFDRSSQTIKVIRSVDDEIFLIPYNSIADTLQRLIFYKAAIASNDNSILLFEEPEAHAFPPYMTQLTQDMIHKRDNQYFIATHSPFILNDLLENAPNELSVFVVYWENRSTHVRALSKSEMHEAYQSGVDFFTNSESLIG